MIEKYKQMKNRNRARLEKVTAQGGNMYRVFFTLNDPEDGAQYEQQVALVSVGEIATNLTAINRTRQSYLELEADVAALEAQP